MLFVNRWRLPLLFLISGAGSFFSLRRRSWAQFAGERLRRLLIPLVFAIFVIVPPQIYFERLYRGARLSYAQFYPSVFELVPYPKGSLSWHHMWFVAYILVFAVLGMPVLAALRGRLGQRAVAAMTRAFEAWPPLVYLANLPSLAVAMTLGPRFPVTNALFGDWANLAGSFVVFLWGFVIASQRPLLELITRRRREFLLVGMAVAAMYFGARQTGLPEHWPPAARVWFWGLVSGYFGMPWIFALVGYARAYVTTPGRWLRYATEAVYPFYIVHQTVTVVVVYALLPWRAGVWPKLAIVAATTFAASWLTFEIVRRVTPLRPLFGLKGTRLSVTTSRRRVSGWRDHD
jgi:glucan biosynthesis protein C